MKRIIAVNSNCYHGYTIEEAVAGIRKAGFRYIELTATKSWTEHVFPGPSNCSGRSWRTESTRFGEADPEWRAG